jgi:glycosyltransferase involved in cell wall biosynthesis
MVRRRASNRKEWWMPTVDVVIPNYQYGRYLSHSIESVLAQSHGDLRVLIIDNASTDDSVAVARRYAARDPRVEVRVHDTNIGMHGSLNEGIDWAQGEYFLILCSDDLLVSDALSRAVAIMEQHPRVVFAAGAYHQMRGEAALAMPASSDPLEWAIRSGETFIANTCHRLEHTLAPLIRTRIQKKVGYHRPGLTYTNDLEVLLRLARFGDVAWTSAHQAIQRLHGSNISGDCWRDPVLTVEADLALYDSFFLNEGRQLVEGRRLHKLARRNLGEHTYWAAMSHLVRGRYGTGAALMKTAIRLTPRALFVPPVVHLLNAGQPLDRAMKVLASRMSRQKRPKRPKLVLPSQPDLTTP